MDINVSRKNGTPIYMQIVTAVKNQILSGELANEFKLPAERVLATQLQIHRNTVIKAYETLISEGLIESSISPRGYFVTYDLNDGFKRNIHFSSKKYPGALNYLLKDEYLQLDNLFSKLFNDGQSEEVISFAADIILPSSSNIKRLNTVTEDVVKNPDFDLYGFAPAQGIQQLRESIVNLLSRRNIHVLPKEILILNETYEAVRYVASLLLSAGDTIIVEEPISPDMFQVFQLMNINVVTVPMDNDGMRTDYLEGLITKYRPKFIYTIPTFHFPTSSTMNLTRRYELLELSYRYDVPIIEEDCDSLLRYEGTPIPSIKSLDRLGNVIYVNSFIATICPGIRIAYVAGPEKTIEHIGRIIENTQMFISPINQYIASEFINRGCIYENISEIISYCKQNRDILCQALDAVSDIHFGFIVPKGGTSLWCDIGEELNPNKLMINARQMDVSFMPGHLFFPFRNQGQSNIRLCFGNTNETEILQGVDRLAEAIRMSRE